MRRYKIFADLRNSKQTTAIFAISCLIQRANFRCKMGRKGALSEAVKFKIAQRLHNNFSSLEIAKELGHDHRTV